MTRLIAPFLICLTLIAAAPEAPTAARFEQLALFGRGWVTALDWSPDGETLAVASAAGVWLYPAGSLDQPRHILNGHAEPVSDVRFSPDGRWLASGGWDGVVIVWDAATGAERARLTDAVGDVNRITFSADGQFLAAGGFDYRLHVWSLEVDGRAALYRQFTGHAGSVESLAFSPDGRRLAAGTRDQRIWLWDTDDSTPRTALEGSGGWAIGLRFLADGRLASTAADGILRLWDTDAGVELAQFTGADSAAALAARDDTLFLAASDGDSHLVRPFDPQAETWGAPLLHADSALRALALRPGGGLATASDDGHLALWSAAGDLLADTTIHSGMINGLAFSPDGHTLAAAGGGVFSGDTALRLWDVATGAADRFETGDAGPVTALAFWPDGAGVAAGGENGRVHLWGVDGALRTRLVGHVGPVLSLAFAADGDKLATGGTDRTVRVWDIDTRRMLTAVQRDGAVRNVALDTAAGGRPETQIYEQDVAIASIEAEGIDLLCTDDVNGNATSIALSPDGGLMVFGDWTGLIRIVDVATRTTLHEIDGHDRWITGLAFSPDGALLASAGVDQIVRVWDVASGALVATLTGHTWPVRAVAFSPDGALLASASEDGTIRLWRAG